MLVHQSNNQHTDTNFSRLKRYPTNNLYVRVKTSVLVRQSYYQHIDTNILTHRCNYVQAY
jgi:hypothetical protein